MHVLGHSLTRRSAIVIALGTLTAGTAAAGTLHRFTVSQTAGAGSLGSTAFLNTSSSGGAVQAQVGPSTMTSFASPFGLFGVYNGTSVGDGVVGLSTTGYGVVGESSSTYPSMIASAQGTGPAFEATTPAKSSATTLVVNQLGSGYGANVFSQTGTALYARAGGSLAAVTASSASGTGVDGASLSASGAGIYGHGNGNGVVGSSINAGSGVAGSSSANGYGVSATSSTGYGLYAAVSTTASPAPSSPPGTYAGAFAQSASGPGVYGASGHNTGSPVLYGGGTGGRADLFAGVYGYGNDGPGIYTYSSNDFGALVTNSGAATTLYVNGDNASGGDLIDASAGNIATDPILFRLTSAGNLTVSGNITYGGTETQAARTRSASNVATYSVQQSEATVEDVGTAQLVNGFAAVPIAADFRDTIDPTQRYQVFLTPAGDNRGLYVASRTPAGFIVREAQGGRSSLAFDFRIVARPYGKQLARLPHIGSRSLFEKDDRSTKRVPASFDGTTRDDRTRSLDRFIALQADLEKRAGATYRRRIPSTTLPRL